MIAKIKNKVFSKIHTGNLVYNTCWEDPRCDRELLQMDASSRVLMLTSAGCNALDYLLDNPASIDCVDMNPRQNALLDLKSALIQYGDHQTLFEFFGEGKHEDAEDIFQEILKPNLEDYPKKYWENNLHFFCGTGIRKSFYWHGTTGSAAFLVKIVLETNPKTRKLIHQLFDCKDLESQQQLYTLLEPRLINSFTSWLFNRHIFQSMLGVPEAQQNLARITYKNGMAGYVKQCFRKVFTEISVADNYFWKVYFLGAYSENCCPNYLNKVHFETLKNRVGRIKTHTSTLSQFLENNARQFTHFVLLDHQDWMAAHDLPALKEEWQLILQNSAPNAKILMRSAAIQVDFIPDFVYQKVTFDATKARLTTQIDRVGTYASVLFGEVN
jgi:S-adenosylmethionine-diacylglycerol 3-amino-3-carboxypropyl transferase